MAHSYFGKCQSILFYSLSVSLKAKHTLPDNPVVTFMSEKQTEIYTETFSWVNDSLNSDVSILL